MVAYRKLSIAAVYFSDLLREPEFISPGENPHRGGFKPKVLWRERKPHASLASGDLETQEVTRFSKVMLGLTRDEAFLALAL